MSELVTLRSARVSRTDSWRETFIARSGGRCHYCNRAGSLDCGPGGRPWHIDHMEPLALGGADDESNLALACKRCNLAKGAQPYQRFVALARASFWVEDENSITDADLEFLLKVWEDTISGGRPRSTTYSLHWRMSDDGTKIICATDSRLHNDWSAVFAAPHLEIDLDAAQFAIEAHRWFPHLIAEIRLLRELVADRAPVRDAS